MSGLQLTRGMGATVDFKLLTCGTCGVKFAIDYEYLAFLRNHAGGCEVDEDGADDAATDGQGGWFCCPNGHRQQFIHTSDELYGDELVRLRHKLEQQEGTVAAMQRKLKRAESARDRYKATLDRMKRPSAADVGVSVAAPRCSVRSKR